MAVEKTVRSEDISYSVKIPLSTGLTVEITKCMTESVNVKTDVEVNDLRALGCRTRETSVVVRGDSGSLTIRDRDPVVRQALEQYKLDMSNGIHLPVILTKTVVYPQSSTQIIYVWDDVTLTGFDSTDTAGDQEYAKDTITWMSDSRPYTVAS